MLIVDAHLDLAWNALQWNRDLLCSVETLRYGFRVVVVGMPCAPAWRTDVGLALVGPRVFGHDVDYAPASGLTDRCSSHVPVQDFSCIIRHRSAPMHAPTTATTASGTKRLPRVIRQCGTSVTRRKALPWSPHGRAFRHARRQTLEAV
jgi:hypothetical protein